MLQNNTSEIYHHGVKGQRWGVRRYQNADGSLTPAGRKRADKLKQQYTELTGKRLIRKPGLKSNKSTDTKEVVDTKKNVKDMTDNELREKTNRMRLENDYVTALKTMNDLNPKQVSKGKAFVDKTVSDVVMPAVTDVAKQLVKSFLVKTVNESLKLDDDLKVHTNNKKKN